MEREGWEYGSVEDHSLSVYKSLGSIPSTGKKKLKKKSSAEGGAAKL
jgi:hypothetical protein